MRQLILNKNLIRGSQKNEKKNSEASGKKKGLELKCYLISSSMLYV